MALFGKKEERHSEIEQQRIDNTKGVYYVKLFSKFGDDKYSVNRMYESIADFANTYNLKIVKISKNEEGSIRSGMSVIFEKRNFN